MIEQNQNIILLILILISVLVAFYALYIGLNNSRKIKKQQQELINIINLNKENIVNQIPEHPVPPNSVLDEFPTLDEINKEVGSLEPLDEEIKAKIDSLENNTTEEDNDADSEEVEEGFENIEVNTIEVEGQVEEVEGQVEEVEGQVEEVEEVEGQVEEVEDEEVEEVEGQVEEVEDDEEVEEVEDDEEVEEVNDDEEVEEVDDDEEVKENEELKESEVNINSDKYLSLQDITEEYLNELNCDDLREISRRENLRLRGRKNELVDRILKKKLVHEN